MAKNLLIVESPAKAATINKYLGADFKVLASYGHVRDLVPREGAVDPAADFAMRYETIERNRKHVELIVKAARQARAIYLATDLDREGEAIAWHVAEILKEQGVLDGRDLHRVIFSEITPRAIRNAVDHPRQVSQDLVDAQQARRALDYLVGFNLSPLLWKKVKPGLSAGRVQSPALRLIVEREEEIERFVAREYWTIEADLAAPDDNGQAQSFNAKLVAHRGRKLEQFDLDRAPLAEGLRDRLRAAAGGKLAVSTVQKRERRRQPPPPFITSTLQQDAARRLRFSAARTMRLAQQLYEGVEINGDKQGLITYMRTDSVHLADDALRDLRRLIEARYGRSALPDRPRIYVTKSRNAQEAHEAIRPTDAALDPQQAAAWLTSDQLKLYELIWRRTVACQMIHATIDTVTVEFPAAEDSTFRATGATIRIPGFLQVYEEAAPKEQQEQENKLPPLAPGQQVRLDDIRAEQHFTEPPPRYSEARLIKTLEDYGIGRPSTYASIISTLLDREYVILDNRRFKPTDTGRVVARFLSSHFEPYVDYEFTARLENELDAISRGELRWQPVLHEFWEPFIARVNEKHETVSRTEARQTRLIGTDPASGKPVSAKLGRYGPFVQLGDSEGNEEKPRFSSLRSGQSIETITLDEALELFKLPRHLGVHPDGDEVIASIGRFGPYLRHGKQFVSLKEDDPHTIDLPRALELIARHQEERARREIKTFAGGIRVLQGRYGPYITDGKKNARVPKDTEPKELDEETCRALLAAAPERGARRGRARTAKNATADGATPGKKTMKNSAGKNSARKKTVQKKTARKKTAKFAAGSKGRAAARDLAK